MQNVLAKIVDDKRIEIAKREADFPLTEFKDQLTPSTKSFYDALNQPNAGYILECKKASPSKGLIRPIFDLDEILGAYKEIAACLSVLTDEKYFQGSLEYLKAIREAVSLPLLRKDFVINERQVLEAVEWGADAILLIVAILDDDSLMRLHRLAGDAGLSVLVEVHDEAELERAMAIGATLVGVNNRDLRHFTVDLGTTENLARKLASTPDRNELALVAESGIKTRADVDRLVECGAQALLVGESLMRELDAVDEKIRDLIG